MTGGGDSMMRRFLDRFLRFNEKEESVFSKVYRNNEWWEGESKSGPGSGMTQTRRLREELPLLVKELSVRTFLDAPCGDFYWMKEVALDVEYIGGDIVKQLIKDNRKKFKSRNRKFIVLDITKDQIPKVDLIFCRDGLVHLSFEEIWRALRNFKRSGSTYLLTTTFTAWEASIDIPTGMHRPLNLQLPPFNFPEPLKIINEGCTEQEGKFADKSQGLWKISELGIEG